MSSPFKAYDIRGELPRQINAAFAYRLGLAVALRQPGSVVVGHDMRQDSPGLAGALVGAIQSVQVGMGEPVLILAFVVIVIGGIGSIKGAMVGALLVGVIDTMGRFLLPRFFATFLDAHQAMGVGAALASMLIYILMALVLILRPKGLFPAHA